MLTRVELGLCRTEESGVLVKMLFPGRIGRPCLLFGPLNPTVPELTVSRHGRRRGRQTNDMNAGSLMRQKKKKKKKKDHDLPASRQPAKVQAGKRGKDAPDRMVLSARRYPPYLMAC